MYAMSRRVNSVQQKVHPAFKSPACSRILSQSQLLEVYDHFADDRGGRTRDSGLSSSGFRRLARECSGLLSADVDMVLVDRVFAQSRRSHLAFGDFLDAIVALAVARYPGRTVDDSVSLLLGNQLLPAYEAARRGSSSLFASVFAPSVSRESPPVQPVQAPAAPPAEPKTPSVTEAVASSSSPTRESPLSDCPTPRLTEEVPAIASGAPPSEVQHAISDQKAGAIDRRSRAEPQTSSLSRAPPLPPTRNANGGRPALTPAQVHEVFMHYAGPPGSPSLAARHVGGDSAGPPLFDDVATSDMGRFLASDDGSAIDSIGFARLMRDCPGLLGPDLLPAGETCTNHARLHRAAWARPAAASRHPPRHRH